MDAVSSISLVASIASLVDFGLRLTKNAVEISWSADGSLETNRELEDITARINNLSEVLGDDSIGDSNKEPVFRANYNTDIRNLAQRSQVVSDDLLLHLKSLKARKDRRWFDVPRSVTRTWLGKGRSKALKQSLDGLQQALLLFLAAQTRDKQDILLSFVQKIAAGGEKRLEEMKVDIIRTIDHAGGDSQPPTLYRDLSALLERAAQDGKVAAEKRILRTLAFELMSERKFRVAEAHEKTFKWVFDNTRTPLKPWLESESSSGVFWVTGKPGSGKSTLMKFLSDHHRTKAALQAWAGPGNKLVIASHFFSAIGSERQKSQEGLLRTLLHDILRQCPSWISLVCSTQVQERIDLGDPSPWSLQELRQTLLNILQIHRFSRDINGSDPSSTHLCLFVDGLDECAGKEVDLIKTFLPIGSSKHIKICLASRPWPYYREAFTRDGSQMLEIHQLTKHDIQLYTQNELCRDQQVSGFRVYDSIAFSSLVDEITQKAQGVFLWVYLVVRSLLEGLDKEDSIGFLKRRLETLPADLDGYYQHVLDGIETIYRVETAQLLRMFLCASEPLPLICLGPALQNSTYYTVDEEEARSTSWAIDSNNSLRKQLHARCGDLLEITPDPVADGIAKYYDTDVATVVHCQYQVDFLHLTVRDFLRKANVERQLTDWVDSSFEPHRLICECFLFFLKTLPTSIFEGYFNMSPYEDDDFEHLTALVQIGSYFQQVEARCRKTSSALIDDFQKLIVARIQERMDTWPRDATVNGFRLRDDFLIWALTEGLVCYVKEKIEQNPASVTGNNKSSLLYHAILDKDRSLLGCSNEPRKACSYIIRAALDRGADPNDKVYEDFQIWLDYLRLLLQLSLDHLDFRRDINDRQNRFFGSEDLLARTDVLLEYGADPAMIVEGTHCGYLGGGSYKMSAVQVFGQIFRPEQVAVLQQRIDKTGGSSQNYASL